MSHALFTALLQDLVQVRDLFGQDIDGLVQVAVAGGLGDVGVSSQGVYGSCFAELAQGEKRLVERSEGSGVLRGADHTAVCGQVPGEELDYVSGDVEHGRIGNQREASGSVDDLVEENRPTRGFTSVCDDSPMSSSGPFAYLIRFSGSCFAEKTSLSKDDSSRT